MAYTTYHSLTGPQGRAYRGYQGTRYESPLAPRSTFETQGSMPMAAQPADEVAQKEVVEQPSPVDAIREVEEKPSPVDAIRELAEGSGSQKSVELEAGNPLEQSIMTDALTDVGTTAGFNALTNSGIAALLGAPTTAAAQYGISSVMAPMAGAGAIADLAGAGLDAVDATGRMGTYGYDPSELDPAKMDAYSDTMEQAIDAEVPSAAQAGIRSDFGPEGFAVDTKQALKDRGMFTTTKDRLATLGGILGDTSSNRAGQFDNGMRMHEDLAAKYADDPMFAPLLGRFTRDSRGGGGNGPGVRGMTEQETRDRYSPSSIAGYDAFGNKTAVGPSIGPARTADAIAAQAAYDRANGLGGGNGPGRGDSMGGGRAASDAGMSGQNDAGGLGGFGMW